MGEFGGESGYGPESEVEKGLEAYEGFGISEAKKLETAREIKSAVAQAKVWGGYDESIGLSLETTGFSYLTNRFTRRELKYLQGKFTQEQQGEMVERSRPSFERADEKPSFETEVKKGFVVPQGWNWRTIRYENPDANPGPTVVLETGEELKVTPKEYFSVKVEPNLDAEAQLQNFFKISDAISRFIPDIKALSLKHKDRVSLKYLYTIDDILKHPDTVVVHYRNSHLGPIIRQGIETAFQEEGLAVGRQDKRTSGFDLGAERKDFRIKPYIGSHSELVARATAQTISRSLKIARPPFLATKRLDEQTDEEVIAWLGRITATIGAYRPRDVVDYLRKIY